MRSLSFYFSPTGGGKRIAEAIQIGMDNHDEDYLFFLNLNKSSLSEEDGCCEGNFPVIFTIPVYGGHMPKIAKERLDKVRGSGEQPAILVAVYGNRAFENALTDLAAFVRERGFNPIAAAAFPCEHSYSTADTPIAEGRPDDADLKMAEDFGRRVREKILRNDFSDINVSELSDEPSPESSVKNFVSFVKGYQLQQSTAPRSYVPELESDKCIGCGKCVHVCPAGAIVEGFATDASLCIKCCACVKACFAEARSFYTPFAKPLSENFSIRKSPRWLI